MLERLQKVMAKYGVASRRKCEELIAEGKVKVNGSLIKEQGYKVDSERDTIKVDGKILKKSENKIYVLLNKPVGYITSTRDQFGRPAVTDLLKEIGIRVFPVGRLDYDSEGLIILTNDGELANIIMHPKYNVEKTYRALVRGKICKDDILRFNKGITIDSYTTSPADLKIIGSSGENSIVDITIHEGRNRQVRKMCASIGHKVIRLKRIRIGKIKLGGLKTGEWRYLNESEKEYVKGLGVQDAEN